MGIENTVLKLAPHRILDQEGRFFIERKNSPSSPLALGSFEKAVVERLNRGQHLSQIILEMRSLKGNTKFQKLYDLLKALSQKKIIENNQLRDFLDQTSEGKSGFGSSDIISQIKQKIKPILGQEESSSHVESILSDESKSFTQRFNELPFIRNLPDKIRQQITETARKIKVPRGTTLIREGERGRDLYVLIEGELGLYKFDPLKKKHKYVTSFEKGAIVGEAGFFMGSKRGASLLSLSDCKVVHIQYIEGLITGKPDEKRAQEFQKRIWYLQALSSSAFFKFLPPEAFDQFLALGKLIAYPTNTTIYRQNEDSDSLSIIVQGEVQAVEGEEVKRQMGSGEVIGEVGVLSAKTPRTLRVRSASDSLVCQITYDEIWKFFSENLVLALEFEKLAQLRIKENPGSWS